MKGKQGVGSFPWISVQFVVSWDGDGNVTVSGVVIGALADELVGCLQ